MAKQLFDYQNDEKMELFVLIKDAQVRVAKNGKQYLALHFEDRSGSISGKYWDATDEDVKNFTAGRVVYLSGKRETYQNNPQVKIYKMRLARDDEPHDPALYVEQAPEDAQTMLQAFKRYLSVITNEHWHTIVQKLLNKHHDTLFTYPAAKSNHHAFTGGLAYHTLSILRLAEKVCDLYPLINRQLLYAGAMLHDLGKTIELSGPTATTYTLAGNLIGHIVLIDEEIAQVAAEEKIDLNDEDMVLLRHMVLAHHGLLEYGSPKRPALLEAEVLHALDDLDASIMMMQMSLQHAQPGSFTEHLFAMDNRQFYRSKLDDEE
ncbi:MAG: HD domain-containing protein [Candidatus Paralactobacillus gallistercoris]|uniref:HD domain-containing protein n=1 Tax=Candidatus Paralactobacillus gallistercoris TaxID=2838724 RepID=A0A948X0X8_9LACO|nr:HD domain-containing protein [Candidatus Paralactobacillus gallistercoris]